MLKKLVLIAALLALCTSLTTLGFAQGSAESSVRGSIATFVSDPSGAVVSDAKVTLTGPTGEKIANSSSDGRVLFQILTPGLYAVKVEKTGFKTADAKDVEVVTGRTTGLNVKLEIGAASTTVEVSADAITVDTTSTSVGANLNDTFYQGVPMGRGVASLFYASPGVSDGGAAGKANPSISGGSGLENLYVADGVSITDGAFGGLGVYSRRYGSLATGINLSFVKEVQVKTGGYEAQYGKSTGGIVQIVTKSGSNEYHGALGFFAAPDSFEKARLHPDDSGLFNLFGKRLHQANYDADAELGGPVPGFGKHLFFFGSFNPSSNRNFDQYAQLVSAGDLGTGGIGSTTPQAFGKVQRNEFVYDYAFKLTGKINDNNQVEASIFGDPTRSNFRPSTLVTNSPTTGDKLKYGTRNAVVRYNGTFSNTWLANVSATWGHNGITDAPQFPDIFQVVDLTQSRTCDQLAATNGALQPCVDPNFDFRGTVRRQGYGLVENTTSNDYGVSGDTSKVFQFAGSHNLTVGYRYEYAKYDGSRRRTGVPYVVPDCNADGSVCGDTSSSSLYGNNPGVVGSTSDATFQLREAPGTCTLCPFVFLPNHSAGTRVYLRQDRGEFGNPVFKTNSRGHAGFVQDNWSVNKYVNINAGLRWDQQGLNGNNAHYVLTGNWSPRFGISVDPWGDRKTKVFANFGRYDENIPLDIAIRSLSGEEDLLSLRWAPVADASNNVIINPDGSLNIVNDAAHLLNKASGGSGGTPSISSQTAITAFAPGTKAQYLDEYVVGIEHEFKSSGLIVSARYTDRRLRRIVEDNAALTPECGANGCEAQLYVIGNVSANVDNFINPKELAWNSANAVPAACPTVIDPVTGLPVPDKGNVFIGPGAVLDSNGNPVTFGGNDSFCLTNPANAGLLGHDGTPDGFVNAVRRYKAMEFEVNKSFSKNWQMRANYRIASLYGNYEGSLRNDNGQTDPNISSLFDFTQGLFNLLGDQFKPGPLNTDVRHLVNGYFSYVLDKSRAKGLTLGTGIHWQTGVPINDLLAHPVYLNAGEIPVNGRGSLGRISNWGSVDFHADYPIRITEKLKLQLGADIFNITNQRALLNINQNEQVTQGVPEADFKKPQNDGALVPQAYQRPLYARFNVKLVF